jgi:hypothetical protein
LFGEIDASHSGVARRGMHATSRARPSAARTRTIWVAAQGYCLSFLSWLGMSMPSSEHAARRGTGRSPSSA